MKIMIVLIIVGIAALWIPYRMDQRYAEGLVEGRRTALHTTPVSEELELVCAGLWVGEQAKKASKNVGN